MNSLPVDVLIFAVIAALIFYRYISILGTTDDEDEQRRNAAHSDHTAQVIIFPKNRDEAAGTVVDPILMRTLEAIMKKDADFDPEDFVQGAKTAFKMIVLAFTGKDMSGVKDFISTDVMNKFKTAIRDREANIELKLEQILDAQIIDASLNVSIAEIIVQFKSTQTIVQNGKSEGTEEVIDLWTFSKSIYADNPIWVLINIAPAVSQNKTLN